MAHSSRGLGHLPLKEEITGSNPVCATKYNFLIQMEMVKEIQGEDKEQFGEGTRSRAFCRYR